jgi:hypothetical protein
MRSYPTRKKQNSRLTVYGDEARGKGCSSDHVPLVVV